MGSSDRRRHIGKLIKLDMTSWLSLVIAVVTLATPAAPAPEPRVVCYYTNWSVYRPGSAKFNPQNINPYLCTHIVYAFGGFTKDNTLKPFDKYQDIEKGGYAKFNGLKTYNKNLKTLLAIGGWNEGSSRFSPMVATKDNRKEFVRNAIKFLRQNHFDGLDLDWEYPAFRDGGKAKDRENYAKLVKELREEFEKESQKTGKPRLLLTMAAPAGIEYIQKGFDIKTMNKYLDWLNLLTYDYHSAFEPAVNHHSPLYPLEEPNEYSVDDELNIDYTVKFYIENGVDREKLVLGIPTYGRSYTLFNPDAYELGSPADGPGEQGDATREKGYLAYYEICEALMPKEKKKRVDSDEDSDEEDEIEEPWTVMKPNSNAMGPVAYKGNQWVGYDDIDIVKKKADYVAENALGGIMFWSIDTDDFRGTCHGKPYPLIEAAKEAYVARLSSKDNEVVSKKPEIPTRSSSGSGRKRPRPKPSARTTTTTSTTTTTTPASRAKQRISSVINRFRNNNRRGPSTTEATTVSTTPKWIATPEPPSTPDPGTDFKCEEEGFFPHPRDCKKYFWCLDSGPSNLGIVAHQFTCPSGLYFNKGADSCDFARNVLCKVTTTTTAKPTTTTTTTTTTARPLRISHRNSVLFRTPKTTTTTSTTTTTTTTTTPEPEPVEEETPEEVVGDKTEVEAEDPKVLKDLIDLIKKLGGVEQLERHLLGETSSTRADEAEATTQSYSQKLYQVLQRTQGKTTLGNIFETTTQNNRGPQNEGLEPGEEDDKYLKKDKPQYTTINRTRPPSATTPEDIIDSDEDGAVEPEELPVGRAADPEPRFGSSAKPLQYVNIRRAKPTVITPDAEDDTVSRNALFERPESYLPVSDSFNSLDIVSARRENLPEYVTIRRQRPTTEEVTTVQYENAVQEDEIVASPLIIETSSPSSLLQYATLARTRGTTAAPPEINDPEPTTVLAVQISSLLNTPTPMEAQPDTPEPTLPITVEISEPTSIATTPSSTTTTETVSSVATTPPSRRLVTRRRGSTTPSTTQTPTPTTEVSSRNYNIVRRRPLLARPNEISSGSEENIEFSRKIRSTTPDSREIDEIQLKRVGQFRKRYNKVNVNKISQSDDSLPAAASVVSRGHIKAQFNQNELLSLTPLGIEIPKFIQKHSYRKKEERRARTPAPDDFEEEDVTEDPVTEPEVKRPSFLARNRNKLTFSSPNTDLSKQSATEFTPILRRPLGARASPSPFTKAPPASIITEAGTKRVPPRSLFARLRPTATRVTAVPQARKLPFSSTKSLSTTQDIDDEPDEEEIENKNNDIHLSETSIAEKEHEENNDELELSDEQSKSRIIVKKIVVPTEASFTQNSDLFETTDPVPTEDGKRKIKVIRRKTTPLYKIEIENTTTPPTTNLPKFRKIIRKVNKPEIQDSKNSESLFNYGEKTRTHTTPPSLIAKSIEPSENKTDILKNTEIKESLKTTDDYDYSDEDEYVDEKESTDATRDDISKTNDEQQIKTVTKANDGKKDVEESDAADYEEVNINLKDNSGKLPENQKKIETEIKKLVENKTVNTTKSEQNQSGSEDNADLEYEDIDVSNKDAPIKINTETLPKKEKDTKDVKGTKEPEEDTLSSNNDNISSQINSQGNQSNFNKERAQKETIIENTETEYENIDYENTDSENSTKVENESEAPPIQIDNSGLLPKKTIITELADNNNKEHVKNIDETTLEKETNDETDKKIKQSADTVEEQEIISKKLDQTNKLNLGEALTQPTILKYTNNVNNTTTENTSGSNIVQAQNSTSLERDLVNKAELQSDTEELTDSQTFDRQVNDNSTFKTGEQTSTEYITDETATELDEAKTTTTTTTTTTTPSTHHFSPPARPRKPYKPPRKLITTTTETTPSSSRTFSRKFNPGVYTSPATHEPPTGPKTTKRPLFTPLRALSRKFTTARTTTRIENEEDEYIDEIPEEEPEDVPYVVPPEQLFTKSPIDEEEAEPEVDQNEDHGQDQEEDYKEEELHDENIQSPEDEIPEEEPPQDRFSFTTKKSIFKPRIINSNTFRTSTSTTELPKRQLNIPKSNVPQIKPSGYNRFSFNRPVNNTKARVQNVPPGYNAPSAVPNSKPNPKSQTKILEDQTDHEDHVIVTTPKLNVEEDDSILQYNQSINQQSVTEASPVHTESSSENLLNNYATLLEIEKENPINDIRAVTLKPSINPSTLLTNTEAILTEFESTSHILTNDDTKIIVDNTTPVIDVSSTPVNKYELVVTLKDDVPSYSDTILEITSTHIPSTATAKSVVISNENISLVTTNSYIPSSTTTEDSVIGYVNTTPASTSTSHIQSITTHKAYPANTERSTVASITTLSEPTIATTTESIPETTKSSPLPPIIKTQVDKLFSVSRVVEVSSKLDKHHLNKNNETTRIEEGKIMLQGKPKVDKIGEVSRYSLIKIVEDEIPIYLTELGHSYPVANPPHNPIRIDEARNARALKLDDYPKDNLIASESIHKPYRHISTNHNSEKSRYQPIHVSNDNFLSYINSDKKNTKEEAPESLSQWQFIPAAFENESSSKLPLESLFDMEKLINPTTPLKNNEKKHFVAYSGVSRTANKELGMEDKPITVSSQNIVTFATEQEFHEPLVKINHTPTTEYLPVYTNALENSTKSYTSTTTIKSTTAILTTENLKEYTTETSIKNTTNTVVTNEISSSLPTNSTERIKTSPIMELLSTTPATTLTAQSQTYFTYETPFTSETVVEETTTFKPFEPKRSKFVLPRKPIIKSNTLRPTIAPRISKKVNATVTSNIVQNSNKTANIKPKSRFTANRVQNVPKDIRNFTPSKAKTYTTQPPVTTTERKPYTKLIRSSTRLSFVPRKSTTVKDNRDT